jgi:DNA-binding response OmpR family regulator
VTAVLLIDDDEGLLSLLREYLEQEGFSVDTLNDGSLATSRVLLGNFAIAVLDIMMPRLSGLEVLRRIRRESTIPILMLTGRGDDTDRVTGLELGADDYVTKPCTPRELCARIRAILRRSIPDAMQIRPATPLTGGGLCLWPEQLRAEWQGRPLALTSTEFCVLEVLLAHIGRPVSKRALSEHVLGRPLRANDRSIDVHVSSIRRKLGALADGRPRIQFVSRHGYQLLKD